MVFSSTISFFPTVDNRRSQIPDAIHVFRAMDSRSIQTLGSVLNNRPDLANCHGGTFHITPLHLAVENNWTDGVSLLLKSGAVIGSRNQYGQTPLHYAAARKRFSMLSAILETGNPMHIDTPDLRGMTPLHDAAVAGCIRSVEVLLKHGADLTVSDNNGQTSLHKAAKAGALDCVALLMKSGGDLLKKDDRGVPAIRYLKDNPEYLETLLDIGIVASVKRDSGFPLTFDYSLLVAPYGVQQCRLMEELAEIDNGYLLSHPLCHTLLLVKWRKTRFIFFLYLVFYISFCALTYTLLFNRYVAKHKYAMNKNETVNATPVTKHHDQMMARYIFISQIILLAQIVIFSIGQLNRLRNHARGCFKSLTWWLLFFIIILTTIIVMLPWINPMNELYTWEHHVATILVMLQGSQILHLISKFPALGIYWLMFIRVAVQFMRVFFIYLCLLVSFSMTFYLALANKESNATFSSFGLTFLKSLTMMVGELDLSDLRVDLDRLPITSHSLLVLFILLISIILANLLVALAVSDINDLRSVAHLMRLSR